MQPSESQAAFEALLQRSGVSRQSLLPPDALRLMVAFYREERAQGCRLEEDGDMLLYQWGTHAFEPPATFQLDLTRQFIQDTGDEEPRMSQMSLTLHYEPTRHLGALEAGNRWCHHPTAVAELEDYARHTAAFLAVADSKPARVTLNWGLV